MAGHSCRSHSLIIWRPFCRLGDLWHLGWCTADGQCVRCDKFPDTYLFMYVCMYTLSYTFLHYSNALIDFVSLGFAIFIVY